MYFNRKNYARKILIKQIIFVTKVEISRWKDAKACRKREKGGNTGS